MSKVKSLLCLSFCFFIIYSFIGCVIYLSCPLETFLIYIGVLLGLLCLSLCSFGFSLLLKNSCKDNLYSFSEKSSLYTKDPEKPPSPTPLHLAKVCFTCNMTGVYYKTTLEMCDQCYGRAYYISHIDVACNKCAGVGKIYVKKNTDVFTKN